MRVCVLGAHGFIGKNLCRGTSWFDVTRGDVNLLNQEDVQKYFDTHTYDVVVHCAVVGGSRLEKDASDVLYKNILMFENVASVFKGKMLYFSSGAALRGNPPS
jgi:nucleoside-diphosphate-sugar epimerase